MGGSSQSLTGRTFTWRPTQTRLTLFSIVPNHPSPLPAMAIARIPETGGPVDMGKIPQQLPVQRPRPLRHALLRRAEPDARTCGLYHQCFKNLGKSKVFKTSVANHIVWPISPMF